MNANIQKIIICGVFVALTGASCPGAAWNEKLTNAAKRVQSAIWGNARANEKLFQAVSQPRFREDYVADQVKQALNYGADPNIIDELGETPLMLAAENGYIEATNQLIEAGTDIYATNDRGNNALMLAAAYRQERIVNLLIHYITKENINEYVNLTNNEGGTALLLASAGGSEIIITQLLASGANPNVIDRLGWTPLMYAVSTNNPAAVEALLKAGADPDIPSPKTNRTALDIATIKLQNATTHADENQAKNALEIIVLLEQLKRMGG